MVKELENNVRRPVSRAKKNTILAGNIRLQRAAHYPNGRFVLLDYFSRH